LCLRLVAWPNGKEKQKAGILPKEKPVLKDGKENRSYWAGVNGKKHIV
jgi:hypothetical protein